MSHQEMVKTKENIFRGTPKMSLDDFLPIHKPQDKAWGESPRVGENFKVTGKGSRATASWKTTHPLPKRARDTFLLEAALPGTHGQGCRDVMNLQSQRKGSGSGDHGRDKV